MIRGTTPSLRFELPFEAADIDEGYITIAQKGRPNLDIPISRCTVEDNALILDLTQEETLGLSPALALIQIRIKIEDKVLASETIQVSVGAILKDGVI